MSRARENADGARLDAPLASPAFTGTPTGITAAHLEAGVLPADVTGGSGLTALGTVTSGVLEDAVTYRSINQDLGTGDSPSFDDITISDGSDTEFRKFTSGASSITSSYTLSSTSTYGLIKNTITGVVQVFILVSGFPTSGTFTMATLPSGYRPYFRIYKNMTCNNWASTYACMIDASGVCMFWSSDYVGTARSSTAQGILISATYPTVA